ncbi:MAG TPA: ATP-binding cassette domain-containing protein, partial [Gemmatales bacterium]|nr:ATP-binding cassette domain-containing protein [Gemmatales bacterium]
RLLAGPSPPSSGVVALNGENLYSTLISVALRRRVTLIFQRPLLLAGTVLDNVEYGLKIRNQSDASRKALAILERVHLEHLGNRPATAISGGEAQLIALARALAFQPEVLLLDEPTNNLDPARVALVEEVVMEDHRQRGTTIIWATHNHFQARRVGDLIALLLDGKIVEVAAAQQFFDAPVDPRTAAFVQGKMVY